MGTSTRLGRHSEPRLSGQSLRILSHVFDVAWESGKMKVDGEEPVPGAGEGGREEGRAAQDPETPLLFLPVGSRDAERAM